MCGFLSHSVLSLIELSSGQPPIVSFRNCFGRLDYWFGTNLFQHLHVQPDDSITITNLFDLGVQNGSFTTFQVALPIGIRIVPLKEGRLDLFYFSRPEFQLCVQHARRPVYGISMSVKLTHDAEK